MSSSDEIFVHTMNNCYYTLLKRALSVTHNMRVKVDRTREITSVVYGRNVENEPVLRIKMADYNRVLVSMGTL